MTTDTNTMRGHRVDEIHAHSAERTRSLLPWLLLGLLAVGLIGWAFMRNRASHGVDVRPFQRSAELTHQRTMQDLQAPTTPPTPL